MTKTVSGALLAVIVIVSTGYGAIPLSFKGVGGGGQGMLVYHENGFSRDGWTGGIGLRGIVEFQCGSLGLLQYVPSLSFWFTRNDNLEDVGSGLFKQYDQREMQMAINLFDMKYMFGFGGTSFKPYAGISVLPCILLNKHHDKWMLKNSDGSNAGPEHDDPKSTFSIGFNALAGVDFPIKDRVIPFIEARFTATKEWAFYTIAGMTLWF